MDLKLEDLESAIKEYFEGKLTDNKISPDIKVWENETQFIVTLNTPKTKVNTGRGGLKLFLQNPLPPFLKVEFNGRILNQEEYNQFVLQYK